MMETMSTRPELQPGAEPTRRTGRALAGRFITGAVVIAALGGLVYTFTTTETRVERSYPDHLESVTPENAAQNVPAQSAITADLEFGYSGALIVNGREIPQDQVQEVVATGELRFTPGEAKDIRRLPGGGVNVTVVYWPTRGSRETDAMSYQWVFNVN